MKFPSVDYLASQAKETFVRFMVPLFFSFIGGIAMFIVISKEWNKADMHLDLACTCLLGMSLSVGCILFAERRKSSNLKFILTALSVLICIPYFLWLAPMQHKYQNFRLFIVFYVLLILVHLWVAVAAYIKQDERVGFWRFNNALFSRVVLSAIFSITLQLGLSLAIAACNILFKLNVDYKTYLYLWMAILAFFNTWFFLTGLPRDYEEINEEAIFPKPLKIFTQYILIPLVLVYMAILYVYSANILLKWELPRGWVSTLILSYEVVGILAILLVEPLRDSIDNPWIKQFSRFFHIASIPLIILLYMAIGTRIAAYGITESRYYLILLGLWIGFIACYFLFSRKKSIKMIPATLLFIGLVSLWGPWGAFDVADRSQVARFKHIFMKYKCLNEKGKVDIQRTKKLPNIQAIELNNIIEFLVNRHQVGRLQYLTDVNLTRFSLGTDTMFEDDDYSTNYARRSALQDSVVKVFMINPITSIYDSVAAVQEYQLNYHKYDDKFLQVKGYTTISHFYFNLDENDSSDAAWAFLTSQDSVRIDLEKNNNRIFLRLTKADTFTNLDFTQFLHKIASNPNQELNTQQAIYDTGNVHIILTSLQIHGKNWHDFKNFELGGWIMMK